MRKSMIVPALALMILATGCGDSARNGDAETPADVLLADLSQARRLGYQIQWQQDLGLSDTQRLEDIALLPEGIAVLESDNIVTLLDPDSGAIRWRKHIGGAGEQLHRPLVVDENLIVTSDTRAILMRMDNGSIADAFDLEHTASTAPVRFEDALIFGTPEGLIFAQDGRTGLRLWEYKMAAPIEVAPVRMGRFVLVADSSGQVALIDPLNGRLVWRTANPPWRPIEARPVATDQLGYVASRDQKLYAFGRLSSDVVWRYLTENPLTESPMLIGDRVFQPTKKRGLVCLDAETGEERWRADLPGRPVQAFGDQLWLLDGNRIHVAAGQNLVETVAFPQADLIRLDAQRDGRLYLAARDGRIMRLAPKP